MVDSLCNNDNKQYNSQLCHRLTVYCNCTPFQILEHLNQCWCPLDMQAKKKLCRNCYNKWDVDKHLNNDQLALVCSNIGISDEDKLQFYLEEIYDSNKFNKQDMLAWEKLSSQKQTLISPEVTLKTSSKQLTLTTRMQEEAM